MPVLCMEDSRTAVIVRYAADLNEKGAADLATQKHFIAAQLAVRGIGWKTVLHNYAATYKNRPHSLHRKRSQVLGQGREAAPRRGRERDPHSSRWTRRS